MVLARGTIGVRQWIAWGGHLRHRERRTQLATGLATQTGSGVSVGFGQKGRGSPPLTCTYIPQLAVVVIGFPLTHVGVRQAAFTLVVHVMLRTN